QALISALGPKVSLAGSRTPDSSPQGTLLVNKSNLFDGPIGYIRISRVEAGLDKAIRQAYDELASTNKLNGLVMDLRFANGTDIVAAAAAADLFTRKEQPLLDWGQGVVRSKEKTDDLSLPLAILVNRQTAAASEAPAAVLRQTGAALILG